MGKCESERQVLSGGWHLARGVWQVFMRRSPRAARPFVMLAVLAVLLLAGCRGGEEVTPTPFPSIPGTIGAPGGVGALTPVPVTIADVLANPEFFEGATVQLTGQYYKRPLLVCGLDPHPSPAEWTMVDGENVLPGAGFGGQMRQLWPDGLTFTAIGRITHFRGPVGCGKQALPTEMWYLDTVKLVEPDQLALVTLTPGGGDISQGAGDLPADVFTPMAGTPPEDSIGPATVPPVAPPPNTPTAFAIETLSTGFTPVATGTPKVEGEPGAIAATETAAALSATPGLNGTIQATPAGTLTPQVGVTITPGAGGGTAITTGTPSGKTYRDMGEDLGLDDVRAQDLQSNETQGWGLPLDAGDEIVISVLGETGLDVVIAITDESQTQIVEQNSAGSGQPETLTYTAPADADYQLHIRAANSQAGAYMLTISDDLLPLLPQGFLRYGDISGATIYVDELHYWAFRGEQGDIINVTLASQNGANLLLTLYDGNREGVGDLFFVEEIENFSLSETGLYIIELEEWGIDQNQYQISLFGQ